MFRVYRGKPSVEYFIRPGTDTHTLHNGSAVRFMTTGTIGHLENDSDDVIIGVARKAVAAGDTDNNVPVQVAEEGVVWEVETDSDGGASATDVGRYCAIDTGDTVRNNATVDISDSVVAMFLITQVVSSTLVRGRFARTALRQPATHGLDT